MKLFLCAIAATAASSVGARTIYSDEIVSSFASFRATYKRTYPSQEAEDAALAVFADNMARAEKLNGMGGARHGVTKFMDMTPAEFKKQYLNYKSTTRGTPRTYAEDADVPGAATSVDWTNSSSLAHKVVTRVKNQRVCGSCWAFSATEQLESVYAMTNNVDAVEFSTQQIVSCDYESLGCSGGDSVSAFTYVAKFGGIELASDYADTSSSTGRTGHCTADPRKIVKGTQVDKTVFCMKECTYGPCAFRAWKEDKAKRCITVAPQSICVYAGSWQTYVSGTMSDAQCGGHAASDLDHCVQVVGYNSEGAKPYYIVRNSWDTDWGLGGFIHLELGSNTCGILDEMTTVTLK